MAIEFSSHLQMFILTFRGLGAEPFIQPSLERRDHKVTKMWTLVFGFQELIIS